MTARQRKKAWEKLLDEAVGSLEKSVNEMLKIYSQLSKSCEHRNILLPTPRFFKITQHLRWPAVDEYGHTWWSFLENFTNTEEIDRRRTFYYFSKAAKFIKKETQWHPRLVYQTFRALKRAKEWVDKQVFNYAKKLKGVNHPATPDPDGVLEPEIYAMENDSQPFREKREILWGIELVGNAVSGFRSIIKTLYLQTQTIPAVPFPKPRFFKITKNFRWPAIDNMGRVHWDSIEVVNDYCEERSKNITSIHTLSIYHIIERETGWRPRLIYEMLQNIERATEWCKKKSLERTRHLEKLVKKRGYKPYPFPFNPLKKNRRKK